MRRQAAQIEGVRAAGAKADDLKRHLRSLEAAGQPEAVRAGADLTRIARSRMAAARKKPASPTTTGGGE